MSITSIAAGLTSLVDVIQAALNARNAPGPSDFQLWKAQDPIARANATIDDYRTSVLGAEQDWATQFLAALGNPTAASADTIAAFTGRRRGTDAQRQNNIPPSQLIDGLEFYCTDTRITWVYQIADTPTGRTAGWKPWDSPWLVAQYSMANLAFSSANVQYRYRGGLVRVKFFLTGTVAVGSGTITMGLPVAADTSNLTKPVGRIVGYDAGQQFAPFFAEFVDTLNIKFQYEFAVANSTVQMRDMTVAGPLGWNTGDQFWGVFEYEPANGA